MLIFLYINGMLIIQFADLKGELGTNTKIR